MITAILLIALLLCAFLSIVGMIAFVILKFMGYEPTDMEECFEEEEYE